MPEIKCSLSEPAGKITNMDKAKRGTLQSTATTFIDKTVGAEYIDVVSFKITFLPDFL